MVFRYTNRDSSNALDLNQRLGQLAGYGLVEGGEPTTGARPYTVDFLSATATIGGTTVDLPSTSVNLEEYSPRNDPRKVVVYIALDDDGNGEYRVAAGEPAHPAPEGALRFDTYEPSPPDLSDLEAAPVAEVWMGGGAQQVIEDDIRDRRLSSALDSYHVNAVITEVDALIDGAGVRHEGALGSDAPSWTDADIIESINTDPDHGIDAPHTYFSADHADLSNVLTDQHHARRTDADVQNAMGGLDAADLAGEQAAVPGMHLSIPDGATTEWTEPPMAEAPVLDSGTITHTGGSATTVTITDVAHSQTKPLDLSTGVSVASPPSWSADYGYSKDVAYLYDDTNGTVNLEITLEWSIDPGAGNDLNLQYHVIDMGEDDVKGLYGPDDVRDAVDGASLSPAELLASSRLATATRSTLPDTATSEIGDTVVLDGTGTNGFGEYVFNGASWDGPYDPGLTSLSELLIDVAADWGGNRIAGLGGSADLTALIRQQDLAAHTANPDVHHAPLTGADIDHAQLQNVQPDQHHPERTAEMVAEIVAGRLFEIPLTTVSIPDGSSSRVHIQVASDEQFLLLRGEFFNENGNTPSGLRLQVRDREAGSVEYGQYLWHQTGTVTDPLVAIDGPREVEIRMNNATGSTQVAGGVATYLLQ